MGLNNDQTTPRSGCSRPLKGCAIGAALLCIAFIAMLIWVARMPGVRNLMTCRENMTKVGEALRRYHAVNNKYPPNLETLSKDYLKDPGVLTCPADTSSGDKPGYTYHVPPANAGGDFVVLECERHILGPSTPPIKMRLLLNGSVETIRPNPTAPPTGSRVSP